MSKRWPSPPHGNPDLDAKAVEAFEEAQRMPPGAQRTEALKKAHQLRNAADTYGYFFPTNLDRQNKGGPHQVAQSAT